MRILALINQKGGVGKTTSAVNLGAALCRLGQKVLLIDIDPQANLTLHCDIHTPDASIYDILVSGKPLREVIVPTALHENLDLVPSHLDLSAAEGELASLPGRELMLRRALEEFLDSTRAQSIAAQAQIEAAAGDSAMPSAIGHSEEGGASSWRPAPENGSPEPPPSSTTESATSPQEASATLDEPPRNGSSPDAIENQGKRAGEDRGTSDAASRRAARHYDFVFIDCPPSLGLLSINALAAAREVLIPLQMEFFALQGMARLMEVLKLMRRRLNPGLRVTGIIPCMYDGRTNLSQEVLGEVRQYFGDLVFQTRIRENIRLAEAPSHGRAIFDYSPSSNGAQDYMALAQEILGTDSVTAGHPTEAPA